MAGSIARNSDIVWKVAPGRSAVEVLPPAPGANQDWHHSVMPTATFLDCTHGLFDNQGLKEFLQRLHVGNESWRRCSELAVQLSGELPPHNKPALR